MKTSSLLVACGLVLSSTLLMRASTAEVEPVASNGHGAAESSREAHDCGGEPCDAVLRGLRAFFDRKLDGLAANGRACADCHMATDNFQLSPANVEARFQLLQRRLRRNPDADDPLFRPIDADDFRINGENASDFSNLRQNGLVRITFPLPPNIWLIDPATNLPSPETFVDVWRSVPTVNDVALTGPDHGIVWPRGPNADRWLPAGRPSRDAAGTGPRRLHQSRAGAERAAATAPRRSVVVSAGAVHEPSCSRLVGRRQRRDDAVAGSRSAGSRRSNSRARRSSSARAAQCHGGPGQSTPQATPQAPPAPVIRFHNIFSQCPRPVDAVDAGALCVRGLRAAARSQCPNLRDCAVGSDAPAPRAFFRPGRRIRRTSSDPGRALVTGFVGGSGALDDWEKFDVPGLRGISKTAPYFINNSAATLEEMVDHYIEFFKRVEANFVPGDVVPRSRRPTACTSIDGRAPEERAALLAYLRKL